MLRGISTLLLLAEATAFSPALSTPRRAPQRALALRGGAVSLDLAALGAAYSASLTNRPVITKSLTSCAIFAFADQAGQKIQGESDSTRTITSALVGLLYFGPALHYWLMMISRVVPGFDVVSTLKKTLLGQSMFGPVITCVFFGASLISTQGLASGLAQWPQKIRQDLLATWASGLCYWPIVDLICYGFVPFKWIPLGYNVASFFWTIYLSIQAARVVTD